MVTFGLLVTMQYSNQSSDAAETDKLLQLLSRNNINW